MPCEIVPLDKAFRTAFIEAGPGFFTAMNAQMPCEIAPLGKGFRAALIRTGKGFFFFAVMQAQVSCQAAAVIELFLTAGACAAPASAGAVPTLGWRLLARRRQRLKA